ncbi:hypothetical protein QE357_001374 [Siphonobacter sp. BAB-5404]|nr:hypothetical protein [Siphonobacter sp. SORGH_AS_1065]MDR6194322.1 hypothetical protein [Siphonobacter sp. SORGH_AS_0500]
MRYGGLKGILLNPQKGHAATNIRIFRLTWGKIA